MTSHLKMAAYPFLLAMAALFIYLAFKFAMSFSLCNGLFLGFTLLYLASLERIIPYDPSWHPSKKEWLRDGIYLLVTMIASGIASSITFYVASLIHFAIALHLVAEVFLSLLITSLGSYIFHRLSHENLMLWRFHGIHHVEAKVNVGNNGVNHALDVLGRRLLAQLPLAIIGFSESALFIVSMFSIVQGYFVHANIDVKFGFLNYFLVSPEQHRLHHSRDLNEAGHFSVDIPLWDLLLGTFTWHEGRAPTEIGVVNPKKFPSSDEIMKSLLHPWYKRLKGQRKSLPVDKMSKGDL
jgi:sterol desaturase/sphingolipid hydroxylase (fatty acid hydroxylase superfamily)